MIVILSIIGILFLIIIIIIIYAKCKLAAFTKKYYGTTSFSKALEMSELLDTNTPKSLMSVESVVKKTLAKDFPELDVNELKAQVETSIRNIYQAIEDKDSSKYDDREYIKSYIDNKINDFNNKNIVIDNLIIHNTVINNYKKDDTNATIVFQTAFEYFLKEGDKIGKKHQDRIKIEFIYLLDETNYDKKTRALMLHCPNCDAPVRKLGHKTCEYCGTLISDIPKRNWFLNKIIQN